MKPVHQWSSLLALLALEAVAQVLFVYATNEPKGYIRYAGLGMVCFSGAGFIFLRLLGMGESVVWVNLAWAMGALFIGSALGIFLEGVTLSPVQITALVMAAISLVLWELG